MHAHEMNLIRKCLLCKWCKGMALLPPAECGEGSPGVALTLIFCLRCSMLLLSLLAREPCADKGWSTYLSLMLSLINVAGLSWELFPNPHTLGPGCELIVF